MLEKIKETAFNISKKKDIADIKHIRNYCGVAYGFYPDERQIKGALEEINCYMITQTKFDLTGIDNPLHNKEIAIQENSYIYFIGSFDEGYCKIGTSVNPDKRLQELQTGCPFKIGILKTVPGGGLNNEKVYHNRFEHYYERGEWFRITGELKDFLT